MDENSDIVQQKSIEIVKTHPYLMYMLNVISESGKPDDVIDYLPDNIMDYMIVDLEAERISKFSLMYNNDSSYTMNISIDSQELDATFTYTFKISERLKDILYESLEVIFGDQYTEDYLTATKPKLTLLKGGKED